MSLWREIKADIQAPLERDPAARNLLEVLLAYPGLHAVVAYRFIHRLEIAGLPVLPRFLAHVVRCVTGIEIHPGAKIGAGLFIDHGMGVVIGGTAVVGSDVTIYQGVTLGGTSLAKTKRHPTVGDRAIIGVGAAVLGDIQLGADTRIGAGSVVVKDVPPGATVVGIPGRIVAKNGQAVDSERARVDMPDPQAQRLKTIEEHLALLEQRLQACEERLVRIRKDDGSSAL